MGFWRKYSGIIWYVFLAEINQLDPCFEKIFFFSHEIHYFIDSVFISIHDRVSCSIQSVSGFVFNYHFPILNIFKTHLINSIQM